MDIDIEEKTETYKKELENFLALIWDGIDKEPTVHGVDVLLMVAFRINAIKDSINEFSKFMWPEKI